MNGHQRIRQQHRPAEKPKPERRRRSTESAVSVPFGVHTPVGVLSLQRHAGNRATRSLVTHQRANLPRHRAPVVGLSAAPALQRGVFSLLGDVVTGAASYAADVGRGFKRGAKGLRVWDSDALVKMHEENASAARLLGRLVSDPIGTITAALSAVAAGLTTFAALPERLKDEAIAKFTKDAAPSIIEGIVAKLVGKALAQKAFVMIANRILTSGVVKQLLKKLGASAVASKTGVGIPLAVFSSLGLIEKMSAAADRLQARFPNLYHRLAADDLQMLWFVIEPHIPAIMADVYATLDEYIDRTRPDGRVLIDAGGSNDRTPIRTGPDRTPIRSGGGASRIPIRSGPD